MNSNKVNNNRNDSNIQDKCRQLMNYHVVFTLRDGSMLDGIIEGVDDDNVTMLVGEDMVEGEGEGNQRQFGPRRFRRYRRRRVPFSRLVGLSLLAYPFIFPPFIF
ncbi:hypothetical protein [Paraclostridium sordellii]|uniref:Uncharacterized protein n=1 Tax=Paraclostridium sordellii TaxID=1505 RepID=A0A0C7I4D2_PARSO|nr:hypothetical protein [Paeniclostridium sordellii]QYE99091.1 hypothetical protein KZ987_06155 [Paeniclostridium sordellii]CEO06835.1 Uncharacterised protein [[Clostridium] sordellii] [Paeniclostridium sordellii]CEO21053.1 Uncharacterised protein [[Clostridium] sordellii] [Paeniclostridium sordellii]CEO26360.1 Uncharacterised protein [[Clostridium] sordellii] [Paeniclostridium sordellii]CEP86687.1 Uncharacterised protein [[Clostridium] sordellii] [Paeniclostridium sordellii]